MKMLKTGGGDITPMTLRNTGRHVRRMESATCVSLVVISERRLIRLSLTCYESNFVCPTKVLS